MAASMNLGATGGNDAPRIAKEQVFQLAPAVALIFLFVILPLCLVIVFSFLQPGTYGGVEWSFSTASYVQFLFEEDFLTDNLVFSANYISIFVNSLLLAITATVLCLIVGFPTAYFIATRPEKTRNIWLFAITVPYWVNLLIRTVAMLFIIRDQGPINAVLLSAGIISEPIRFAYTNFAIGLGLFYSYLPFMVLPIYAALECLDFSLVEAAHDLYATRRSTLWNIIIPVVKPGIIAGCLLVFIPSLGSFIAPDVLGGGKNLMIGNLIALQFQGSRNWPFGAAIAVILLTLVLSILTYFAMRGAKGARQ
jgi:spermidine/putrescine transport system permease protein